jgi:hypothetical protein
MTVKSMDRNLSFITDPTHRRLLLRIIRNIEELNAAALYGSSERRTNKGNIVVADGSVWNALPVGDDGQVLTADSTQLDGVSWTNLATTGMQLLGPTSVGTGSSVTEALSGTVERICVAFADVSVSTIAGLRLRLGTGGTLATTGYDSRIGRATAVGTTTSTVGVGITYVDANSGDQFSGIINLEHLGSNLWAYAGTVHLYGANLYYTHGAVTISGPVDIVGLVTLAGVFDGGYWRVSYQRSA